MLDLRNRTYAAFVELGRPTAGEPLCDLGHAWWDTRLRPDWRPRTGEENQSILDQLGLVGPFWALP